MKHSYKQFLKNIKTSLGRRKDVVFKVCAKLNYKTKTGTKSYDFVKIYSREIKKTDKVILIAAGLHGDEVFGPLTLMKHIGKIFDYAHQRGIKLIVFPLNNPSGFEGGTRYNIENDRGEAGNNDFMRYILKNGKMVEDLRAGKKYASWIWSSDSKLKTKLPKETRALHKELKKLPLDQVNAVIDLHADNFINGSFAYQYGFGDFAIYKPIINKIKKHIKILANKNIDSGYFVVPGYTPEIVKNGKVVKDVFAPVSDQNGFILRHDGTLPDLFYRLGAKYCVTTELTKDTKQSVADIAHLEWIKGIIELVNC